jgi:methyltransferase (TIGR00027 family)
VLPFGLRAFVRLVRPRWAQRLMIKGSERDIPGMWSGMLCRKRYIQDRLIGAVGQIDGVVDLGAGMDTLPYRLSVLSGTPVWDVDLPEDIRAKEAGLRRALGAPPHGVSLVPIDFDHEDLAAVLESHGYSVGLRTFFVWEGVTQYLMGAGIRATFDFLSRAASGGRLVFTYVRKDFIDGRVMYGWQKAYAKYVQKGLWLLGLDPAELADFIGEYGWRLVEDLGYDELAERYMAPSGRVLATTSVERIAYAEKQ